MPKQSKENKELKTKDNITKKNNSKSQNKVSNKENTKASISKVSKTNINISQSKKASSSKLSNKQKKEITSKIKKSTSAQKNIIEYYDLPNKYNKTVVKILAQTPKTLFIYWEISDYDIENYKKQYGENFFEITKPVLIIHNSTLNYSFEVEINDFANSWYLHINDSKSDYSIELGRRPIQQNNIVNSDYIFISSSNKIESPNDHILFNTSQKMVYFRNVKTKQKIEKPFSTLSFIKNMGKIYDIFDIYKELYKNEDNLEILSNPSSNTSSQFK